MSKQKKLSKNSKRVIFISFIYLFVMVSFLSPFIAIEGSNLTLAIIIAGILTFIYLLILLVYLWDWLKAKAKAE